MKTIPFLAWNNQSLATSQNSLPVFLEQSFGYSIDIVLTIASSLNGTFTIQYSNYFSSSPNDLMDAQNIPTGSWVTLDSSSQAIASGTPNPLGYNVNLAYYRWIRLVWTASSGTGTATAYIIAKGL